MIILGIDPGYDRLGIAIIEKPLKGKEVLIYSDCFTTSPKDTIYDRLKAIGAEIARVIETYNPEALAIETLFITKNQKTAMRVSEARGIIIYEGLQKNIPIFEYSPMEIKMAITSDGTSDKERVTRMVQMLITLPKKSALDDEYDAIAVALTHSACAR
ncbi:MAG TPA: crossover junction endodeoxyribonuclease RuvC [Candidatus Paceibacterota bacterium]|jgi:crossover junction endodeoxyribonuclease RuvC|nr:crossover junction endodeoxyribonuclease RuvC [Candidatus Paceibacterota bacterium]